MFQLTGPCTTAWGVHHRNVGIPAPGREAQGLSKRVRKGRCAGDPASDPSPAPEQASMADLGKAIDFKSPKVKAAVDRITAASEKVAEAESRRDKLLKEMDRYNSSSAKKEREREAQAEADQLVADAEVAASEKLMKAAELRVKEADAAKEALNNVSAMNEERIESLKAGVIAGAGGFAAVVPLVWAANAPGFTGILNVISGVVSCGLFGITYRYAISVDDGNTQLKGGAVTAFSLVRALGGIDTVQAIRSQNGINQLDSNLYGLEFVQFVQCFIIFGFAAAALEASMKAGYLKTFGKSKTE